MPRKSLTAQELLEHLISFDTTSRQSNMACIDFMRDYLDGFGVHSDLVPNDEGTKACLWATVGAPGTQGIALAGHTDTVPVDDQTWTSDPFKLREQDGRLFGRGTADMKGFIACALALVPDFLEKVQGRCFHLALTYDEEISMMGAVRLTEFVKQKTITPSWIWVGEPTGLTIVDQHKGVSAYKTSFKGVTGHSGQPKDGLNAIGLANHYMNVIGEVASEKEKASYAGSRFDPPYSVFNLGTIKGGSAENVIAGACDLLWQIRAYPGETAEDLYAEIDQRARQRLEPHLKSFAPEASVTSCTCFDIPAFLATASNKGAAQLKNALKCVETHAVGFATEAGIFQQVGADAVICGPGFIAQAHQPDEYIDKKQLVACVDLMREVLLSSSAPA